jgi:hypothetical protein
VNVHAPVIDPMLTVQDGLLETAVPLMVTCRSDAENPLPYTATVSPGTPCDGVRVMVGPIAGPTLPDPVAGAPEGAIAPVPDGRRAVEKPATSRVTSPTAKRARTRSMG